MASARRRPNACAKEIFKNDAFDRLRAAAAEADGAESFDAMCARRITTITGDVARDGLGLYDADRSVLATCDIVIHSAATVSFDSPLDSAVEINLLGPTRIVTTLDDLGVTPHLVAVSTCYVAGNRRGNAPEELVSGGPFDLGLDWRDEVAASPTPARRRRGGEPPTGAPRRVPRRRARRARRRRRARARRQDRAAPRAMGQGPSRRGRSGTRGERRLAGRVRVHEGARRAGADRRPRATCR